VGQDDWFAALGPEAASVISSDIRPPKDGTHSLQIHGAQLGELEGFFFGSYARPLSYAPLRDGMPRVAIEAWVALVGDNGTCGTGLGLTSTLLGQPVPNILIGIQAQDTGYVSYLSNYDANIVYGPAYKQGEWIHLRAVLDYESRTVEGFVDSVSIGMVPFTTGISDEVTFMNISLGSNHPIPNVVSYVDGVSVASGPRRHWTQ
jgi:hypothetical protein